MRFFIGLVAVLMSLVMMSSHAEPVAGVYQVREELVSQESDVRDAGLQQAFVALVQRLTGQTEVSKNAALADYMADPQALISRYGYEGNTLVVNFDPSSVQAALQSASLPVWDSARPVLLAWWLVDDLNGMRLISDGQSNAQKIHTAAQYAGIPARFPLGDLSDQLLIGSDPLRSSDKLRASAERYKADAVMLVQQALGTEVFEAQWHVWLGEEQHSGASSADSQEALARDVFAQVNAFLAERFAVKPGEGESLSVRVSGVDLERFVLLERLLEPFAAQLYEVNDNYAEWHVHSSVQQLRAQLVLADLHERSEMDAPSVGAAASSSKILYFSW